jgi:hypothetical protein
MRPIVARYGQPHARRRNRFDIKIPDRDMTPSNFRSIAQIDKLVRALLRSDQKAG